MGIKSFRYIESKIGDPLFRPQYYTNQRFLFNEYIVSQNIIDSKSFDLKYVRSFLV